MQWMGLMVICCGMTVKKRSEMVAVSTRKMKIPSVKMNTQQIVKMERVTLTGKGIWNLMCLMY